MDPLTKMGWHNEANAFLNAIEIGDFDSRPDILMAFAQHAIARLNETTGSQYRLVSPKKLGQPAGEVNVNPMPPGRPVRELAITQGDCLTVLRKVPSSYQGSKFEYRGYWYSREAIVGHHIKLSAATRPVRLAGETAKVTGVGPKRVQVVLDNPNLGVPSPDGVHVYLTYSCLENVLEA